MKPKPKGNLFPLLAVILLLTSYLSFSQAKRPREPYSVSIDSSSLYLRSSLSSPVTIKVYVLGSIMTTPEIRDLIECESGGNPNAINLDDVHYDIEGNKYIGSFGLLMFGIPTWEHECVERFGIEDDIDNPNLQIQCTELLLEAGEHWRWENCWRIIHE